MAAISEYVGVDDEGSRQTGAAGACAGCPGAESLTSFRGIERPLASMCPALPALEQVIMLPGGGYEDWWLDETRAAPADAKAAGRHTPYRCYANMRLGERARPMGYLYVGVVEGSSMLNDFYQGA
ncbi:MAG: hypothetical protein ACLU7D_04505 [Collinsella sp.]